MNPTDISSKNLMRESTPVIIRMAANVEVNNCTFSNNSAGFTGDYIFAAALMLEKLIGTNMSTVVI